MPESALDRLLVAAERLAGCTAGWQNRGYASPLIYTCLTRERDIANPDNTTRDWWPKTGPCAACELRRALNEQDDAAPSLFGPET